MSILDVILEHYLPELPKEMADSRSGTKSMKTMPRTYCQSREQGSHPVQGPDLNPNLKRSKL